MKNRYIFLACLIFFTFSCSEDYLEVKPKAAVTQQDLATDQGVDAIIIGAYKGLTWSITGEYGG
ncbi:MAG TPA: RagB/SusD family nutrient uptake outer membrane protein, partial [Cyclobacteriaceae bacterium]